MFLQVDNDRLPLRSPLPSFLISSTAQMFICSAADILSLHYYINTQRCHYTINTKGLFRGTACRHVFVFLNGPQNVELHKSLMGEPIQYALCLGRRGFAISEIINNSTTYGNFPAPSCVSAWQQCATGLAVAAFML